MLLLLLFALVFSGFAQNTPALIDLSKRAQDANNRKDYSEAEQIYRSLLERARAEGDRAMEAESLRGIGESYQRRNQWKESLQYYEPALAIQEERKDGPNIAYMLAGIGQMHANLREDELAEQFYRRGIQAYAGLDGKQRTPPVVRFQGIATQLLAQLKLRQEKFAEAQPLLTEAAGIFALVRDEAGAALVKDDMAEAYRGQSDYRMAIKLAFDALEIQRRRKFTQDLPRTMESLGNLFLQMEQPEKALDYYQQCLDLRLAAKEARPIAQAYNNIGLTLDRLERLPEALESLSKALEIRRTQENPADVAQTLINRGSVQEKQGKIADAGSDFEEALKISREGNFTRQRAVALYELGNLALRAGRVDQAIQQHAEALALRQQAGDRLDAVHSLNRLALSYEARGDLKQAEKLHASALEEFEKIAAAITDPEQVGRFRQSTEILYPHYAKVLLKQGRTEEAFAIAERSRGAGLARMAAAGSGGFIQSLNDADRVAWLSATADRSRAANRLGEALGTGAPPAAVEDARTNYLRTDNALQQLRDRIYAATPALGAPASVRPETGKILSASRAAAGTLYLEWLMVDNSSALLFAVSGGRVRGFELPAGRDRLTQLARQWQKSFEQGTVRGVKTAVSSSKPDPVLESRTAAQLYTAVFGPLTPELQKHSWSRLVLVPDGPLLDLPFAGLLDEKMTRLIVNYSVTTAVSMSTLIAAAAPRKTAGVVLVIGDPLDAGEERVVPPDGGRFGALVNARAEAQAVAQLFPGKSLMLTGSQAREEAVKQNLSLYQIVHFATHGILSRTEGMQSGLLLASERVESPEDGVLQAWEIADSPLAAELVVLSACDTAEGDERLGEGLMGLAWAFQAAGSPNVLASLWSIDDEATRKVMEEFYRLLRRGSRIDDAMRGAMLSLMRSPGTASPYYWAGFRIIGPAASIPFSRN